MQTIIRTNKTTNFTILDNAIINAELSALAKMALIYLLSKPSSWKLRATDIKRHLGIGINKVYRLLKELREAGYIVMQRIQSAVQWFVYDAPQSNVQIDTGRAESHRDGFHHDGSGDDIVRTERAVSTEKPQQRPPIQEPIQAPATPIVVVKKEVKDQVAPELDDPIPHIPHQHQHTAKKALGALSKEESDAVVVALTLAMSKGGVSNPIGYLLTLVKASKNGTFSPVQAQQAPATPSLSERIAKERQRQQEQQERGRMSVEEHQLWLQRTYGTSTTKTSIAAKLANVMFRTKSTV